jgi:hypothetical protein
MDKQLHEKLERLHAELQRIDLTDPEEREHVAAIKRDIRSILDEPSDDRTQHYTALGDRLRDAITRLESSYPNAAVVMGQVVDQLALLGL